MNERCETIELLLAEYAADELAPGERDEVARHLATCPACREELARELRLRRTLAALPAPSCPTHVTRSIQVDVEPALSPRAPRHWWGRTSAGLGLAAAAVLLALVLPTRAPRTPDTGDLAVAAAETNSWTQDDLDRARLDVEWVLGYTANIIDRTEKQSVADMLRHLQTGS